MTQQGPQTVRPSTLNARDIDLQLSSSRQVLELGEPFDILLRIENRSAVPIWITAPSTTLTIPAELVQPTQSTVASTSAMFPNVPGPGTDMVCILPGGTYTCSWRPLSDQDWWSQLTRWQRLSWHLFFHPGKYEVWAQVQIWTQEPDLRLLTLPQLPADDRDAQDLLSRYLPKREPAAVTAAVGHESEGNGREFAGPDAPYWASRPGEAGDWAWRLEAKIAQARAFKESMPLTAKGTIEVTARSWTILMASAIGGILGFFFRWLYVNVQAAPRPSGEWVKDVLLLPAYILTAVVISLLISRITEARLPFTIKIMDFWGATVLGILAAWGGNALINTIFTSILSPGPAAS